MALHGKRVGPSSHDEGLEKSADDDATLERLLTHIKNGSAAHECARFLNPAAHHPCNKTSLPTLIDHKSGAGREMTLVGTLHPTTVSRQVALGLLNHARCGVDSNSENVHWVMYRDDRLHEDHVTERSSIESLPFVRFLPIIDVGCDGALYSTAENKRARVGKIDRHGGPPLCIVAVGTTRQISVRSVTLRDATCSQSQPPTQPGKLKERAMRQMSCLRACLDEHRGRDYDDEVIPAIVDKNHRGGVAKLRGRSSSTQLDWANRGFASVCCTRAGVLYNFVKGTYVSDIIVLHDDNLCHWGNASVDHHVGAYVGLRWWLDNPDQVWTASSFHEAIVYHDVDTCTPIALRWTNSLEAKDHGAAVTAVDTPPARYTPGAAVPGFAICKRLLQMVAADAALPARCRKTVKLIAPSTRGASADGPALKSLIEYLRTGVEIMRALDQGRAGCLDVTALIGHHWPTPYLSS